MVKEDVSRRRLHKVTILVLKVIPMLLAFCEFLNTVFGYFEISAGILSFIGSISLLPLIFLYLASYAFGFCAYHRMFLHYILLINVLDIYDYYVGIPISSWNLFVLYVIIAAVFLFIILYLHQKEKC